jgi:hypothetical protein
LAFFFCSSLMRPSISITLDMADLGWEKGPGLWGPGRAA